MRDVRKIGEYVLTAEASVSAVSRITASTGELPVHTLVQGNQ